MWEKFNKTKKMIELSQETSDTVTSSVENWKSYLNTASQFYKYSFDDQIMIHAQRPDCTACASIPIWNKKMLRWVKSGSKGIALIREKNQKPYLTYVFALEDTITTKISKTPYLWKMEQQHYDSVLAMLEQYEGNIKQKDIAKRLMEIAISMVDTHNSQYFKNMLPNLEDTYLGELNEQQAQSIFRDVCITSIQYVLLHRCGIDTEQYISDKDLQNVMAFTTPEMLHHLGTAVNEISNDILRNIEKTVKTVEKSIAISQKKEYNQYKEQFNTLKRETEINEGSFENDELHQSGRLHDTRFGDGERAGRQRELGKYGLMRGEYLKKTNRGKYNSMLLMDKLWNHLLEVDETAQQYEDNLIEEMMKTEGVTEKLKAHNQMKWVQKMNNIRQRAEEMVRQEMIYI